jgi:hypothetical protein
LRAAALESSHLGPIKLIKAILNYKSYKQTIIDIITNIKDLLIAIKNNFSLKEELLKFKLKK